MIVGKIEHFGVLISLVKSNKNNALYNSEINMFGVATACR